MSVADPSVEVPATVTAQTGTTLTVTTLPHPAGGQYRLVVTGRGGASTPNAVSDVVTALQPYAVALGAGQVARSDKASPLIVTGSGFGTTSTAYLANKVTATVAGKAASVGWISDTQLKVTVPVAAAGTARSIVISRKGVASDPVAFDTLRALPAVTLVSPNRVSVAGGASVTVTVRNAPTSSDAATVTLVSTSDPSVTATGTITARTATGLTFTAPASRQGGFHVVVSNAGGDSLKVSADVLGFRTTITGTTTATQASAAGGTQVTVSGSGFGATSVAYGANKITATVNGKAATVKWVSDTSLLVTVPLGLHRLGRADRAAARQGGRRPDHRGDVRRGGRPGGHRRRRECHRVDQLGQRRRVHRLRQLGAGGRRRRHRDRLAGHGEPERRSRPPPVAGCWSPRTPRRPCGCPRARRARTG